MAQARRRTATTRTLANGRDERRPDDPRFPRAVSVQVSPSGALATATPGVRTLTAGVAVGLMLLATLAVWPSWVGSDPRLHGALQGGAMAALATALGTLPVLLSFRMSQRTTDTLLGFGAGVMLAATCFSLVIPALRAAADLQWSRWGSGGVVGLGLLLGAAFVMLLDRVVPHEHFVKGVEGPSPRALKRVWLFVIAIALHNLPEGLAIGVGFAGADANSAHALATGIAIQDVPEGMVIAMALRGIGYGRGVSVALGAASGLVEPIAAVAGFLAFGFSVTLLPWGLALAGGAMLFVISHEIIPESHRQGHETWATCGLMIGFVVMMVLDTSLG